MIQFQIIAKENFEIVRLKQNLILSSGSKMWFSLLLSLILLMETNSFQMNTNSPSPLRNRNSGQLNGDHLKFVLFNVPPFNVISLRNDGNYTDSGSNSKIFNWLTQKLNFTISYVPIPNEMTKRKYGNQGDVAVALKLIAEKEVDGSSSGFIQTTEREKFADFAYYLSAEPHAMVVPRPGEEPRLFAFIQPFQPSVWLLLFISSIFVVALMCQFSKAYSNLYVNENANEVSKALEWAGRYSMYIANILTNQGNSVPVARLSFRVLVGAWLLVAMVLVNSYSGTVISYLTVPKMKPPINTFEDLVASPEVQLILLADTIIAQQILESNSGATKILGDQIRSNPNRILSSLPKVNDCMENGRFAFPFLQTISNSFVVNDFKKTGKCHLKTTDPLTSFQYWCLTLQKNSKFTSVFNQAMLELRETGLPSLWKKMSMPLAPKCFAKAKPRASSQSQIPIRLNDLTGAFFILGIGYSLTVLAFLAEKSYYIRSRRQLLAQQSALNRLNAAVCTLIVVNPNQLK